MKKVLSLATIMLIALIVLTGCVDVNYEVTLNKDGTADVAYVYGFDKATLEQMGSTAEDMTSEMKQNAEASEYEIEPYSDDKVEGFKAKKHVENLSDISLEEAFGSEYITDSEENRFKVEKKGSKTFYSQNAKIDLSNMDSSMASMVTMKYTVKLPTKVGENNASEVSKDGKTLTWNLTAGKVNEINFEANSSIIGTVITIVIIALVVIGVTVAVVIVVKKSKKEKSDSTDVVAETTNNEEKEVKNEVTEIEETTEKEVDKEETSEEEQQENETKEDEKEDK